MLTILPIVKSVLWVEEPGTQSKPRAESAILTNLRRKVFSRSAPMHPANPRMNITPPTTRKSQTGSKPPRSVMDEMLERTPWERKRRHEESEGEAEPPTSEG